MKWKIIYVAGVLIFFVTACSKGKPVVRPITPAILSVKLYPHYVNANEVDSAFANWVTNGQEQRITLDISNDSLVAKMEQFNEGNGEITIHIFSNKKYSNQYFGQWILKKSAALQKTQALHYAGPTSFYDANWYPRVELADGIGHKAIVALRPDDAYFLVKNPGHAITRLTVDRGYWKTVGGISLGGRDIWQCSTGCTDVADEEFFRSLPGRIGTKPWNHISIAILFEINDNGEGWGLSLEHEP